MRKILFLLIGLLFAVGLCAYLSNPSEDLWTQLPADTKNHPTIAIPSLAPLVARIKPAVLVVTTESTTSPAPLFPPGYPDYYRFYGPQAPNPPQKGLGSGFIIHPSGLALTNNHVIEKANKIKIKVGGDFKEYEAVVVGSDPDTDVALIQIKSPKTDWPVIPLGTSSHMQVGDFALAIGNPLGLEHSISFGPISALGRRDIQPSGKQGLFDFMQLSASINPGNSGGALLNLSGEVIGINTAINASGQGIAFAIPIDQVKQILPQLKKHGKATRSVMGVRIDNLTSELAQELGLKEVHGALVREVLPDSAAFQAGIQPGDVITEFDDKLLSNATALSVETGLAGVGKKVKLKVLRDGQYLTLTVTLQAITENKANPVHSKILDDLGVQVADSLHPVEVGALVLDVRSYSPAEVGGLEKGDVITRVNQQSITKAEQFVSYVQRLPAKSVLRVLLKRQHSRILMVLQKP